MDWLRPFLHPSMDTWLLPHLVTGDMLPSMWVYMCLLELLLSTPFCAGPCGESTCNFPGAAVLFPTATCPTIYTLGLWLPVSHALFHSGDCVSCFLTVPTRLENADHPCPPQPSPHSAQEPSLCWAGRLLSSLIHQTQQLVKISNVLLISPYSLFYRDGHIAGAP